MNQGRFSTPPLAPEDDWFAEPDVPTSTSREEPGQSAASASEPRTRRQESRRTQRPDSARDRRILVAAVSAAVILLVGGVLVARALTGSDGAGETTQTTLPTTTATTTTTRPTTTTPTTTTPTTTTLPEGVVLRKGDESADVSHVQAALVELGYSTDGVDGKFGPATEQAVKAFQKSSGLTEDGVVGPATLAAMSAALNKP
jgi:cytoskeletal protein RodZ